MSEEVFFLSRSSLTTAGVSFLLFTLVMVGNTNSFFVLSTSCFCPLIEGEWDESDVLNDLLTFRQMRVISGDLGSL